MRRSQPSSKDLKGLPTRGLDVCSIASTETASTVAGRGRLGGLRKRSNGIQPGCQSSEEETEKKSGIGLYTDPFSSMFSPTSVGVGTMGGLMGKKLRGTPVNSCSGSSMGPPDARRSHSTLIGSKQNTHLRSLSSSATSLQSIRVDISPTGSPVSSIPPSITSTIAPTMNAFRRCLLLNRGRNMGSCVTQTSHSFTTPPDSGLFCQSVKETNDSFESQNISSANGGVDEVTFEVEVEINGEWKDDAPHSESHVFLFDDNPLDSVGSSSACDHLKKLDHVGGKEKRSALQRRNIGAQRNNAQVPYCKPIFSEASGNASSENGGFVTTLGKRRRACRSRYTIDDDDADEQNNAIYYVKVSHSALTPRDAPEGMPNIPQIPLLPSSVATAVVDAELAVLEELML